MREKIEALRDLAPAPRSVGAVVAVLMLVLALAGGGAFGPDAERAADRASPTQNAEAALCGGICVAGGIAIAAGAVSGYALNDYLSGDDTSDVYTKADAGETKTSVYTHATTIEQDSETFTTVMNNKLGDGDRTVAWSKGKIAVVQDLNDGQSKATAKANGTDAVDEYYAVTETNVVKNWNSGVEKMDYLDEVYQNHENMSSSPYKVEWNDKRYAGTVATADYELVNGTTTTVKLPTYQADSGDPMALGPFPSENITIQSGAGGGYTEVSDGTTHYFTKKPDGTWDTTPLMDPVDYNTALVAIKNGHGQMVDNIQLYTDNTYADYSAGDINMTQLIDPTTLAQEMSTNYEGTGYYAYASADLAAQGTPGNLNQSMTIETSDGTTLNGTIFTDWEPSATNGTFETGYQYNPSNGTLIYVATNDGLALLDGESFTITSMENTQTGEAVNSTSLQSYNRQTADTTLTAEQLNQLLELQQRYDDMEQDAAGGGGSGLGGDLGSIHVIGALVIALAAAVVFKD